MPSPDEENAAFAQELLRSWDREMGPYTSDEVIDLRDGPEIAQAMIDNARAEREAEWLEIMR